eukprot:436754_1
MYNSPQAPTLSLGKYSNNNDSEQYAFNFGSFGDGIENSTWSNSNTGNSSGWGDEEKTSNQTESNNEKQVPNDVHGLFKGDSDSSVMTGPPGFDVPMKTV